jgi:hypothetical protein
MNIEINIYSTRKRFEECVREETACLTTLKSKKYLLLNTALPRIAMKKNMLK